MKKKGSGISLVLHPTGNKGAGDPSQAAIQLKPDGTIYTHYRHGGFGPGL
jgi:hypothetical protein